MNIHKVKLVYFSATGTTQTIVKNIAAGIKVEDVEQINLTLPDSIKQAVPSFTNELVIIGAPVYGGRLPVDAVSRFKQLRANNTLAVLVVLYGNRDYEDALLELKKLSIELGFIPVAGAAFIGEHSFSSKDNPIASGRPNQSDIGQAIEFGEKIKDKLVGMTSPNDQVPLEVSGIFPYEAGGARALNVSPVVENDTCTICGVCSEVCPTDAISIQNDVITTETEMCIRCCACIKSCPEGARLFQNSMMKSLAQGLSQYFSYPKEPRFFGICP